MTAVVDEFTLDVMDARTDQPLQRTTVDGRTFVCAEAGLEFYIRVSIADPERFIRKAKFLGAHCRIDGVSCGREVKLTHMLPENPYLYFREQYVGNEKLTLTFQQPHFVEYQNEAEEKEFVEKNKSSPIGTVVVDVWTSNEKVTREKPRYVGNNNMSDNQNQQGQVNNDPNNKIVYDTYKFYNRPSFSVGMGRSIGYTSQSNSKSTYRNRQMLATLKVWFQSQLVIDVLKRKEELALLKASRTLLEDEYAETRKRRYVEATIEDPDGYAKRKRVGAIRPPGGQIKKEKEITEVPLPEKKVELIDVDAPVTIDLTD
eukprot:Colp12_sorted_trinity150504_noHs@33592